MTIKTLTVGAASLSGLGFVPEVMGATDTAFQFANDGNTIVAIENNSGVPVDFTFDVVQTAEGLAIVDPVVTVPDGEIKIVGPFKTRYFNNSSGLVTVTPDVPAITLAAQGIRLPHS